jgi:enhancer of polycomb-like protein
MERKRVADREWEDFTDGAYLPISLAPPTRFYRSLEASEQGSQRALTFSNQGVFPLGAPRPAFRKRIGRGGRIVMDRITPALGHRADLRSEAERVSILTERWRYDSDVGPDEPDGIRGVLDDFTLPHTLRRLDLLRDGDVGALRSQPSAWLEQAASWLVQGNSSRGQHVNVVGKLPVRIVPQLNGPPAGLGLLPLVNGQANTMGTSPVNGSNVSQMLLAATQAQQHAALNGSTRRSMPSGSGQLSPQTASAAAPGGGQIRRSTSAATNAATGSLLPLAPAGMANSSIAASISQNWAATMGAAAKLPDGVGFPVCGITETNKDRR